MQLRSRSKRVSQQESDLEIVAAIVKSIGMELRHRIPTNGQDLVTLLASEKFDLPSALARNSLDSPKWSVYKNPSSAAAHLKNIHQLHPSPAKGKGTFQVTRKKQHVGKQHVGKKYTGLDIPANPWILDAFKTYVSLAQRYLRDVGHSRMYLSALFQGTQVDDDQLEFITNLKWSAQESLDDVERQVSKELDSCREYALDRPKKVLQLAAKPNVGDLRSSILATDDKVKISVISSVTDMITGYSTLLSVIKEVEHFTGDCKRVGAVNYYL